MAPPPTQARKTLSGRLLVWKKFSQSQKAGMKVEEDCKMDLRLI